MKSHTDPPAPPRPEVRDAVAGLGVVVGELVHALSNPVSVLSTSLELLLGGQVDAEDLPHLHRVMRNELSRLNDLLARCGELSRLRELALAPLDLAQLVRARVEARATELTSRGVALALTLPEEPVMVMADEAQLGGSFDALVSNAVEAMPAGGTLAVALERDAARGEAVLTVRDNGQGIAATALPNVFRLFIHHEEGRGGPGAIYQSRGRWSPRMAARSRSRARSTRAPRWR